MEKIKLSPTAITPLINFDGAQGLIEIFGRSVPENSMNFFDPLLDWMRQYTYAPNPNTVVNIHIEYFNTSSSKCILQMFKMLESVHGRATNVKINWFYHDEDVQEVGEDYQMLIKIPFEYKEL